MLSTLALLSLILVLLAGTAPALVGYESFVVYSGSMAPAINVGDLAVVAPTKPEQLRPGDVITYRTPQNPNLVVTHRLVDVTREDQGRFSFQTKGDANPVLDTVAVDAGAVLGRVAYTIPKLGYLVDFSKRAEGKVLLIGIPGLLLVLDYLLGAHRRRDRKPVFPGAKSAAADLVTQGRAALLLEDRNAAVALFDQAIAADPRLDEAWLLKAQCLESEERLACLRAALTVNPGSDRLRQAVERESEWEAAAI